MDQDEIKAKVYDLRQTLQWRLWDAMETAQELAQESIIEGVDASCMYVAATALKREYLKRYGKDAPPGWMFGGDICVPDSEDG